MRALVISRTKVPLPLEKKHKIVERFAEWRARVPAPDVVRDRRPPVVDGDSALEQWKKTLEAQLVPA
jgi:hypothetical protein